MLCHAQAQARQLLLLDFLAPSLFSKTRPYSTQPQIQNKPPFPLQASSTSALFAKLRNNVQALNSSVAASSGHYLPPDKLRFFNQTITNIRKILGARGSDKSLVLQHWQALDQSKLIHLLGHTQLAPLSNLMIRSFLTPDTRTKRGEAGATRQPSIDPSIKKLVENIALLSARGDSFIAINILMRHYIREGDTRAVLNLYDKFMSLIGDKDLTMEHESEEESGEVESGEERLENVKDLLATGTELKFSRSSLSVGRVQLLLAAVTAHAIRDSFKDALDLCLSTVIQLDLRTSQIFLQTTLEHDELLREKVRIYLFRLRAAKLVSRPAVFASQVTEMGNSRSTETLEKLYANLVEGLSGDDAFLAADPSLITKKGTVALTGVGWTALLTAFLRCERKDLAGRLWDDMTRFGMPPGVSMWTALIDAYEQIRAVDDALAAWNMMLKQGVQPDALAYRAIISALFKGRRPGEAMEKFSQFKTLPIKDVSRHLSVWNTTLHSLCASDCAPEAEALREEMEKNGPKPDNVTYNTFVNYYGRRGQFQGVADTFRSMKKVGLYGDAFTYTTILSALLKAGKMDAAELVLSLMDKQGVKRNVALYTTLIDHQLREGGERNFRAAMKMLDMMENDPHNPPNEITYTSVLSGLYRIPWMDPEELKKWETSIIQKIRERGISLALPTYHLLMKACLTHPHENGVHQALAYFEEMKRREIPIINTTWYILFAGLMGRREWDIADKLVAEMYASGIHPTGSLLRLVHQINNRATG